MIAKQLHTIPKAKKYQETFMYPLFKLPDKSTIIPTSIEFGMEPPVINAK